MNLKQRSVVILLMSNQWMNAEVGTIISEFRSTFRYSFYKEFGDKHIHRNVNMADVKGFCEVEILPLNSPIRQIRKSLVEHPDLLLKNTFEGCTKEYFMQFLDKLYSRGKSWKGEKTSLMVINWKITDIDQEKFNYLKNNYLTGKEAIEHFLKPNIRYEKRSKEYGWALKPGCINWKDYCKQKE